MPVTKLWYFALEGNCFTTRYCNDEEFVIKSTGKPTGPIQSIVLAHKDGEPKSDCIKVS